MYFYSVRKMTQPVNKRSRLWSKCFLTFCLDMSSVIQSKTETRQDRIRQTHWKCHLVLLYPHCGCVLVDCTIQSTNSCLNNSVKTIFIFPLIILAIHIWQPLLHVNSVKLIIPEQSQYSRCNHGNQPPITRHVFRSYSDEKRQRFSERTLRIFLQSWSNNNSLWIQILW